MGRRAAVTERIAVLATVHAPLVHPVAAAKQAATVDHITGGRVVLGLGSGWQENEHRQYGIEFYDVAERLARLDEACAVIKALYSEPVANFTGQDKL